MKIYLKLALSMLLTFGILHSCKKEAKEVKAIEKDVATAYNAVVEGLLCKSDWFPHSNTPAPKEGPDSPFALPSTTNAIFHQWSWQKFLWVTKPDYTFDSLYVNTDKLLYKGVKMPLFLNPNKMHQVTSNMAPVPQQSGAAVVLESIHQAGRDSAVLTTNPDFNTEKKTDTVYYSLYVDPIMKKAATEFRDSILNNKLPKNNLKAFPVGSLELKVSWVAVDAIPADKLDNYFTTIGAFKKADGTYENKQVAFLGMHVVGVVENHPEFIWATFEHDGLAPNYDWKKGQVSSKENTLLFKKGTATGIDGIKWNRAENKPRVANSAFDLFQYGVPRNPGGDFMNTAQEEPINFRNIDDINKCVKKKLKDVWKNYFYNGSIWIDTDGFNKEQQAQILVGLRSSVANAEPQSFARGSLNCANVTMETFTQTFKDSISQVKVGNLANCFSCHNAVSYSNNSGPMYMSHIFNGFMYEALGNTAEEVEQLKSKQEVLEALKEALE